MAEWIYFIHPPRDDFAETMTDEENEVWDRHFEHLSRLLADGALVLAGPTLGRVTTGIIILEAPDEASARAIMERDPATAVFVVGRVDPLKLRHYPARGLWIGDATR